MPAMSLNQKIALVLLLLAIIGFADAAYLSANTLLGRPVPCPLTGGCETVTNSPYSRLAGVPLSVIGAVYYLILIVLALWYIDSAQARALRGIIVISGLGFLWTLYLTYLQGYVIGAWCVYCLVSAATTTLVLITSWWLNRRLSNAG